MTRPICLQVYISSELSSLIRKAAKARGISMSEWVRALLANACSEDELASRFDASISRAAASCSDTSASCSRRGSRAR